MLEMLSSVWNVIWIIVAFSVLVFVHELGHFLAALLVGIRPERFFIGFDIYGLGIKKEYKGCVYGIGLLPLGGYVKLAGQSDDPREQGDGAGKPDEYRSKPLWAQAIVITAGVFMNLVFGFLLLFCAYLYGMPQNPPQVGSVTPGSPAAFADLQPGDRILSVNGKPTESLNMINEYVVVNPREFYDFEVERAGQKLVRRVKSQTGADLGSQGLGIHPATDAVIEEIAGKQVYGELYEKVFKEKDVLVEIAGQKIPEGFGSGDFARAVIEANAGKNLPAVVLRDGKQVPVTLPVLATGSYPFGYTISIAIEGVISGGPAEAAGLRGGLSVNALLIDGVKTPLRAREDLTRNIQGRAYQPVELTVRRGAQEQKFTLTPRFLGYLPEVPAGADTLLGVTVKASAEGQGAREWEVEKILPEGPAAGKLQPGDRLLAVNGTKLFSLEKFKDRSDAYYADPASVGKAVAAACCKEVGLILSGEDKPLLMCPRIALETGVPAVGILMGPTTVQSVEAGSPAARFLSPGDYIVQIMLADEGRATTVGYLGPDKSRREPATFKTPDPIVQALKNGKTEQLTGYVQFGFAVSKGVKKSVGVAGALGLAFDKSIDMSLTVYKILHRLVTGQISASNMSGPVGIFNVMQRTAESPDPMMSMIFLLALISINLAVFNLLPFPVLDGGHLLFIIVEAVRGTPPGERFRELSQYFGILCLLSLMVYVTYNDIARLVVDSGNKAMVENALDRKK